MNHNYHGVDISCRGFFFSYYETIKVLKFLGGIDIMKKVVIFMAVFVFAIGMTGCKDEEDKKSTTKEIVYEYDGTKWREEVDDEGNVVSWDCITETQSGTDHIVLWEDQTYWDE